MMKKLRFLVSLHTRENDFQVAQGQSAEDTARKLGSDVEIVFADNDAVNQSTHPLKAIQGRVESRPDAIVVEPVGSTAMPRVAQAACATGIGWAVLNKRPDYLSDLRSTATAPIFCCQFRSLRDWTHSRKTIRSIAARRRFCSLHQRTFAECRGAGA